LLLSGALVLAVLLFIAPRTASVSETVKQRADSFAGDISVFVKNAESVLTPADKTRLEGLKATASFDSLVSYWNRNRKPEIAAYYAERTAERIKSADSWILAGQRYYNAVQFVKDEQLIPLLYQSAMRCASNARKLEPENISATILLGKCYVDGTDKPMDGITILKEAERKDSLNPELNLAFAFFSVKSGQLDKAIARFHKVLRADSTYIEAYLHLADCYEQTGKTNDAISMLRKYGQNVRDISAKMEIEKYIEQLKKQQ
jgi:tetratricopeptide (TPR) repeat protein